MEIEIYKLLFIALVSLGSSYVQSVTGFGFGITSMVFLPYLLAYTEANVLSTVLASITSMLVVLVTYRKVNLKNIFFPLLGSIVTNYLAVAFMKSVDNKILILLLGVALFVLSVYFFFFSDRIRIRPTWYAGLIAGLLSGLMSGLFSIGGPPVVVYYIQSERDTDSYLATISVYFVLSGVISAVMKAASGFVTTTVLYAFLVGAVGMAAGALLGKFTRGKTNPAFIKKAVYGVMAISGIINVVTSII